MLTNAPVAAILPATDLKRAKEFYTQKLGLKQSNNMPDGNLMFEAGMGTMLMLYKRPPVKVEHTQAGFKVNNLEETVKELRGKGVKFEDYDMPGLKTVTGIMSDGKMKAAWFKDSEGNILAIIQM
jgi:predicted enzyme related to lactoylglutathione lyase